MSFEDQWYHGKHKEGFAEAVKDALENAEKEIRGRQERLPTEYEVRFAITAHGPLSDYKAAIKPSD